METTFAGEQCLPGPAVDCAVLSTNKTALPWPDGQCCSCLEGATKGTQCVRSVSKCASQ